MSSIRLTEQAAAAIPTPPTGKSTIFLDSADGLYKVKDDTGTVTPLSSTQDLWETISSDSGSTAANSPTDTLTIAGGSGISTAIAADTLTITNDSPNADQDIWETVAGDTGSTTANTTTDTLTIAGGTGISTAVTGDTLTITNTASGASPDNLVLVRSGRDCTQTSGSAFNIFHRQYGATGTSVGTWVFAVPASWDTTQDPTVVVTGYPTTTEVGNNYRFEYGIRSFADTEVLDNTDDETITFTETANDTVNQLQVVTSQTIDRTNLAIDDFLSVEFRRLGGDAADTRGGNFRVIEMRVTFPRDTNFGVYT